MTSTRLPGKVLAPILGRPLLARQIERLRHSRKLDHLRVATSIDVSDDAIEKCCLDLEADCFRGSLDDVLDRFYQAACSLKPEHVVRVTGDCPLLDPALLDDIVVQHLVELNDYTSNVQERSYPDGLDVEVITFPALEAAWRRADSAYEREHVTPYFSRPGSAWKCGVHRDTIDRSAERWVVDYPEDLEFVREVYGALYPSRSDFGRADVHELLARRPEVAAINAARVVT